MDLCTTDIATLTQRVETELVHDLAELLGDEEDISARVAVLAAQGLDELNLRISGRYAAIDTSDGTVAVPAQVLAALLYLVCYRLLLSAYRSQPRDEIEWVDAYRRDWLELVDGIASGKFEPEGIAVAGSGLAANSEPRCFTTRDALVESLELTDLDAVM